MGSFVIGAFRPKPGREQELLDVMRDHMPTLRSQGLVTDRPAHLMRAKDGTMVEVFEWKSEEAIRQAHENPTVRALWDRFDACSTCTSLREVPGTESPFPGFEPVELT